MNWLIIAVYFISLAMAGEPPQETTEEEEAIEEEYFVFYEDEDVTILYEKDSTNLSLERLKAIFDEADWNKWIR